MTPEQFAAKWKASTLRESQASQEQFIDLCRLLDEKTPAEADPDSDDFCFERGAAKLGGGDGFADVWKRGHFAWEYKGKHKDLDAAYRQLQQYRDDLENPPLLVVSDMERFILRTNWTTPVQRVHEFALDDFLRPDARRTVKHLFERPEALKPGLTREALTQDAAARFSELAPRQFIDTIIRGLNEIGGRFAARNQRALNERIVRNPTIMQGKPVIRGTRIAVELILRKLGGGLSPAEITREIPS